MSEFNKSYRIRTEVGKDKSVHVKLDRSYDILEIMSLKINQENAYKLHTSNYGVVTGRVIANGGFGVPNAKISVFINIDDNDINDVVKSVLYPYNTTLSKDKNDIKYNLLPNEQISNCHTIIGTFPEKQYMLDNDNILEVFEKYYKFTTRTNNSGDYMIFGVPTGTQTIHMDVDLSDIGILSQKPRDMVYKGYHASQFENPNKFKHDTNLTNLVQVISQDITTDVIPFWGDNNDTNIGITRCDIDVQYKFEPTCVFMGSVVTDNKSNGISRKCIPMPNMGAMDEITTGSGTIEMIRKTPEGNVEEFQIMGTQLIDGDGVWCYQIPMNLDYVMTDEYGNMVPTNNPDKGIPTRTKVRFRISMQEFENNTTNMYQCKMLVPHNPNIYSDECSSELDYQFGSLTKEDSFKDLFWNGVYSVKSYIPRIQKGTKWKSEKFTGFKRVNYYNDKNPIPYNNIRIKLTFIFSIICFLFKMYIKFVGFTNKIYRMIAGTITKQDEDGNTSMGAFLSFSGEMCNEDLDYLCIIPGINILKIAQASDGPLKRKRKGLLAMAIVYHYEDMGGNTNSLPIEFSDDNKNVKDNKSIDSNNKTESDTKNDGDCAGWGNCIRGVRVTDSTDYLIQCMEIKLAEEYRVIQFDFYNDWINGLVYIPRWVRTVRKKRKFLKNGQEKKVKIKACDENFKSKNRNIVQQCALRYNSNHEVTNDYVGCSNRKNIIASWFKKGVEKKLRCHKDKSARKGVKIFKQGGILKSILTSKNQYVYYFKPYEEIDGSKNIRLFATDIILLGTLNDCDKWGIPNDLTELSSTSYQLPPNLALVDSHNDSAEYGTSIDTDKRIYITFGKSKGKNSKSITANIKIDECYTGVDIIESDGSYTEMAGIDWAYSGPLQEKGATTNELFKPGGHFLGISCRNAETTIKTCVNLSRICELGVWMSQRQDVDVLKNGEFVDYATVPSGLITKDDISDSNYRSAFASMNYNKLKTKINPKTLYPIYDFKFISPNNFNGDLKNYIHANTLGKPYNRHITDQVIEYEYEYESDESDINRKEIGNVITNETQIMRTGEYKDNEYYKFRFGNTSDVSKNYMINDDDGNYMPLYDNSYYFYFGLHEGKTAIDKFKEEYYAVCQKSNDLIQTSDSITLRDINIEYDGLCPEGNNGSIKFRVDTDLDTTEDMTVTLKNDTEIRESSEIPLGSTVEFKNLDGGDYTIIVDINGVEKTFDINIPTVNVNCEINGNGFIKDTKNNTIRSIFGEKRNGEDAIGGFITIKDNKIKYISGPKTENDINLFEENSPEIIIKYFEINKETQKEDKSKPHLIKYNKINNRWEVSNYDDSGKWVDDNNDTEYYYNLNEKNNNNELIIPVPVEDKNYYIYLNLPLTNCKNLDPNSTTTYELYLGEIYIDSAQKISLYYNGLEYSEYFGRVNDNFYLYYKWDGTSGKYILYSEETPSTKPSDSNDTNTLEVEIIPNNECYIPFNKQKCDNCGYEETTPTRLDICPTCSTADFKVEKEINGCKYIRVKKEWWELFEPSTEGITDEDGLEFDDYAIWKTKESLYQTSVGEDITHDTKISILGGVAPIETLLEGVKEVINNGTTTTYVDKITNENDKNISKIKIPTLNYNNIWDYYRYQAKDINGQTYPKDKFKFPVVFKPFFMEVGVWYFEDTGKYYLGGNVYNGKTYDYKNYGFNSVSLNNVSIANIDITHPDNWMEIDEINRTNDKGGYNYKGNYCKYNGRKTAVNREIEPSTYNIYADKSNYFDLNIGCRHEKNGIIVKDNTSYIKKGLKLFNFELEGISKDGEFYFRMNLKDKGDYKSYMIYNKDVKEKSCYKYPKNREELSKSKLFSDIMDNNIELDGITYYSFDEKRDWVKLNDLNGKSIYYVAIIEDNKESDDNVINTSNSYNKIKSISVSNLIDTSSLKNYYPLDIEVSIIDYDSVNNAAKLKIKPEVGSEDNFKNKKIELFFYYIDIDDDNIQLLSLSQYTGDNKEITVYLSIEQTKNLELNKGHNIKCSYYVYKNEVKSPTIYNIEDYISVEEKKPETTKEA